MTFSWAQQKLDAIATKQRRNRTMARKVGSDYAIAHPGEARDAAQGNYTVLNRKTKELMELKQQQVLARRSKLVS